MSEPNSKFMFLLVVVLVVTGLSLMLWDWATAESASILAPIPIPDTHNPIGWLDAATCEKIAGWAVDMGTPNNSINVHIYKDGPASTGTFVNSTVANVPRSGVNSYLSIPGDHGFLLPLPDSLKDGQSHDIYAYGIDSSIKDQNTLLTKSPMTITCS